MSDSNQPDPRGFVGPVFTAKLPPHLRLLLLTDGKRISAVVHVLTELGVADQLADGPKSVAELASALDCDEIALGRVLRVASGFGVFAETGDGGFAQSEMSEYLRSDREDSQRDLMLFNGDEMLWRSYGELAYTVRTGKPAFEKVFGQSFFTHLERTASAGRLFDAAMRQMSRTNTDLFIAQHEFGRYRRIADVGGGNGHFLAEVLRRNASVSGVLIDQPSVVAESGPILAGAGVADRVTLHPGDFFGQLPGGCDAYLLKSVLHNWSDDKAASILRRVRAAMADNVESRLLICEFVVGDGNRWDRGQLLDIDMLLRFGGQERDVAQWRALLETAGLRLVNEPVAGRWAVLECAAA